MTKRLSIILPSFNDARIAEAIESVRRFDDIDTVKLVIIDGGSRSEIVDLLKAAVRPGDIFVSEPDKGIFDGLNKGLDQVDTEFLGWLGSDDLFTGQVKASDVVSALGHDDLFVTSLAIFQDRTVRRLTSAWPSAHGLVRVGLHNPHYSTFGRSALLQSIRFRLDLKGSDIDYFLRIFATKPRVRTDPRVGTLQREGGFSTAGSRRVLEINRELFSVYRDNCGLLRALVALPVKLGYKLVQRMKSSLHTVSIDRYLEPGAHKVHGWN
jgi:glycosyltransferase